MGNSDARAPMPRAAAYCAGCDHFLFILWGGVPLMICRKKRDIAEAGRVICRDRSVPSRFDPAS